MEDPNTPNPNAFPVHPNINSDRDAGMTLRDYFANSAMQGICVNTGRNEFSFMNIDAISVKSYELADAMLKQREL